MGNADGIREEPLVFHFHKPTSAARSPLQLEMAHFSALHTTMLLLLHTLMHRKSGNIYLTTLRTSQTAFTF